MLLKLAAEGCFSAIAASFNILLAISISLFFSTAYATETLPEKGEAVSKDIKREANKAVDRIEEGTCTDSTSR